MAEGGVTVAELSRQVRDALIRFEGLTKRLEDQFIRKDILDLYKEGVQTQLRALGEQIKNLDEHKVTDVEVKNLSDRVAQLEDDKKWLIRIIIGFVILGILGVFFATGGLSA